MDEQTKREWLTRCAQQPGAEWRLETRDGERKRVWSNEGTFDELTVDHWLHVEQLDERTWWMRVGDVRVQISIEQDGAATVDVDKGFYESISGGPKG